MRTNEREERGEKAYEKHAWTLIAATAIFRLFGSLILTFSPQTFAYGITGDIGTTGKTFAQYPWVLDYAVPIYREIGIFELSIALFILAIALKSFRRGEKWAWYVLWLNPLTWIYDQIYLATATISPFLIPGLVTTVVGLLGLLLPYRKFFPKKAVSG